MPKAEFKKFTLSSSFEEIQNLEDYINELQEWAKFGNDDYARIMLTISEAATNAIVHGNKEDADKEVAISCHLKGDKLTINVQDEGEGFDPSSLADPVKEENLLNEGGRGVYLIEEYADEVRFSDNGKKLTMVFLLDIS